MRKTIALSLYSLIVVLPAIAAADSQAVGDDAVPVFREREGDTSAQPRPGSGTLTSKQYDPRLPPVLPGEVVVTESGDKMRVWSSAGPVPVHTPPAAPTANLSDVDLLLGGPVKRPDRDHPLRSR